MFKCVVYEGKDGKQTKDDISSIMINPLKANSHIFCDCFFTNTKFISNCSKQQIYFTGTVKKNSKLLPHIDKITLNKGKWISYRKDDMLFVKFEDKRIVNLLSSFYNNNSTQVEKFDKEAKCKVKGQEPEAIHDYILLSRGV